MTDQTLADAQSALAEAEERVVQARAAYHAAPLARCNSRAFEAAIRDRRLATERLAQVRRDAMRRAGA